MAASKPIATNPSNNPFPGYSGITIAGGTPRPGPAKPKPKPVAAPGVAPGVFDVPSAMYGVSLKEAVPYSHGLHDLPLATAAKPAAKPKPATDIAGLQKFLVRQGYQIPVDGQNGPLTIGAAADWRSSRNPQAFNVGHGLINNQGAQPARADATAPATAAAPAAASTPAPKTKPSARTEAAAPAATTTAQTQGDLATQARQLVQQMVDAETKRITDAENARSANGTAAIQGYTTAQQQLLSQYSPLEAAAYGGAVQGQNAIDQALTQRLQGSGDQLSQELGGKLAAIAADPATAARIGSQLSSDVTGAANTAYAKGSASLSDLNARGAAAGAYNSALPGIASLGGLQAVKGLQGSIASDQATQLGQIASQVPGLAQSMLSNLTNARNQETTQKLAALLATGYDPKTGKLTPAVARAVAQLTGVNAGALGGTSASGAAAAHSAAVKAAAPRKVSATLSKAYGIQMDSYGEPMLTADGKTITYPQAAGKPAPKLSAAQAQKLKGDAATIAANAYNGFDTTDKNGNVTHHPPLTYQQAIGEMAKGVPGHGAVPLEIAQAALNERYRAGERSRPWLTFQQRQALLNAGAPPKLVNKAITNNATAVALVRQYGQAAQ